MASSLTEFHLFPILPSELRLKIWGIIICWPRIVDLRCSKSTIKPCRPQTRFITAFLPRTPNPFVLYVCRESRHEALATYKKYFTSFKSSCAPYSISLKELKCIYLAPGQDTVRFREHQLQYMDTIETESIEKMLIDVTDPVDFGHYNLAIIMQMNRLKELELLTPEGLPTDRRGDSAAILTRFFEAGKAANPGWECPRVRITSSRTEKELKVLEAGALIPGWVPEPDLVSGMHGLLL